MKKITVFIVEDDPMVLEVNQGFLARLTNFELVGSATTGESAYQAIMTLQPDIILLDMFLPDISGLELFLRLRQQRIVADVIAITAARDAPTVQEVLRLGAVDYLIKPFRFERFEKALVTYYSTQKHRQQKELLQQSEIDQWLGLSSETVQPILPKGLNELTMSEIKKYILANPEPITSEELAKQVGMARVTVRKYVDYLATHGKVKIELRYGTVGRPTKFYSLR